VFFVEYFCLFLNWCQSFTHFVSPCFLQVRDEEVFRRQEENRRNNAVGAETESRIRGSTVSGNYMFLYICLFLSFCVHLWLFSILQMKQTDEITCKLDVVKKPRAVNMAQKEATDARRKAKAATDDKINAQLERNEESRAIQAESRLKFLLQQSDIFSHFGVGKDSKGRPNDPDAPGMGSPSSSSRDRRQAVQTEEMDEEEAALAAEEGGIDDGPVLLKQPPSVMGEMRAYQLEGLNWMIKLEQNGINGILADEMGLGKTLQSISMLGYLRDYKQITGPHLIIVPKSTLSNWGNELKRWCPAIRVMKFHGSKDERLNIVENVLKPELSPAERSWDVCITTYEVANLERNSFMKVAWRYLIIDEAHRIKNEDSQFSRNVRMLNTEHRLLLTGTPLQNNLHELWALLNYLLPDVFASSEQFDEWFNLDVDDVEAKQRMISQLHKLLRPFMLRRLKADVEASLLPKKETVLFTGMSAVQKQLYRQVLLRDIDVLQTGGGGGEGSRTTILNIVMQLRKCCNHPYLFPGIEDRNLDPLGDHLFESCGKMVLLDKLLGRLQKRDNRVLIFSQMTKMLDIMEDYCIAKGYSYCRIDGNTSYEDREDRIAAYNAPGSEIFIFLLSTRAGGLGINLQTADTVILYDSDWNPQADLQAQDRAHRIGQKKQVHVFRLVTDDTVEVKVVERAQQKLKLDAMVVQQGRLVDKEKKLSKDDLLDTLRFGADKIFRSKDTGITDDDIDTILEQGQKRTDEMNEKLTDFEKGDMYNFKLDGGKASNTQIFEGKDYSDKSLREGDLLNSMPFYIDVGKRERKAVQEYNPAPITSTHKEKEPDYNAPKMPRHLRLPKMEDWQFYDRTRLSELSELEVKLFDEMVERKESIDKSSKCVVLPPELHEEKLRLLDSAFSGWTKMHFNNFVRACARYGRSEPAKIAKDIGRPVEEVERYAEVFFTRGADAFNPAEMERIMRQIEKGERRLEEIQRLTSATGQLINMFADPWEELTFKNVGNVGRIFNSVEDRYLLCLTQLHGFGSWDLIRASIRRCERFRFDYFLQSCSSETLGKRCEMLMRSAERELLEIDKKRQQGGSEGSASTSAKDSTAVAAVASTVMANQARLKELVKQIALENKHMSNARSALQKLSAPVENIVTAFSKDKDKAGFTGDKLVAGGGSASKAATKAAAPASAAGGESAEKKSFGAEAKVVPDEMLPELAK